MRRGWRLKKYLISSFDESYLAKFGVAWYASLRDIAKFDGVVMLIAFDMSGGGVALEALRSSGAAVVGVKSESDKRLQVLDLISEMQAHSEGTYAYFDIDGYFESSIDELYERRLPGKMHVTEGSLGFLCGDNRAWSIYRDYRKFERSCSLQASFNEFAWYNKNVVALDASWNCTESLRLPDGRKPKFFHYGRSKNLPGKISDLPFSYERKYPESFERWSNTISGRSLHDIKNIMVQKKVEPISDMG